MGRFQGFFTAKGAKSAKGRGSVLFETLVRAWKRRGLEYENPIGIKLKIVV
jgi:hypothetical protein